ncbi:MAG TPA: response regulator [Rhodocyclaceae bacterium]|nr:response regulator [Rhodocyclaceae bacterium]
MHPSRTTVLIVDDNEIIRLTLRSLLRSSGLEVIGEATDGVKGVAMAVQLRPDLICLDVLMPKMSGLEALAVIRTDLPSAKVLMVTGQADRETIETAIGKGAHGIILKPFRQSQILDTIKRVLD